MTQAGQDQESNAPAAAVAPHGTTPADPDHASREIEKATLVPLNVPASSLGQVMDKLGFVSRLGLRPGEVDAASREFLEGDEPGVPHAVLKLLSSFEGDEPAALLPSAADFADVPVDALQTFGQAVVALRRESAGQAAAASTVAGSGESPADLGAAQMALHSAVLAVKGLEVNSSAPRLGWINLERLEMSPTGVERGELISTIPLAPLEETAVVHKEWSVQKKEFTSIVTDSLEDYSESGVTDNTELSQSTNSQQQHSNQFNVTGTVSGGIPVISGSVTSGFTSQGSESQSASDSRKHATSLTHKASTRARQEHKVTISTTTVTGTSQATTRKLKNPSATEPVRIDYFSLIRKWRVRLYRHGLRMSYDIVLPEPGAAMRHAYVELATLRNQLGPFVFNVPHNDITADVREEDPEPPVTHPPTPKAPHYLVLADRFNAPAPPPPPQPKVSLRYTVDSGAVPGERSSGKVTVHVPPGYEIQTVALTGRMTSTTDEKGQFTVEGTSLSFDEEWDDKTFNSELLFAIGGGNFMAGVTGSQPILLAFDDVSTAILELIVDCVPTKEAMDKWRSDVWNGLYNAAQTQYYAQQQDIAARITALEERLNNVDTLTLRREENDELMKAVLRYLLGGRFPTMPPEVVAAFKAKGVDIEHGTGFDSAAVGPGDPALWSLVQQYEEKVRFVNQAIEWENVVTFLYSYFWDVPESWRFVRGLKHPDPNRQAFLRAGSARVVLTVRKGWETRWVNFVERGVIDDPAQPSTPSPYWTIAQEIAAYDDRNYPGIPPANPGRTATRLQDAVFTSCSASVGPSPGPVMIPVASTAGLVAGAQVVIDTVTEARDSQEAQTITKIPTDGPPRIEVGKLTKAHPGTPAAPIQIMQPGEKGTLIAEWNEYTPSSGTDIEVSTDLAIKA